MKKAKKAAKSPSPALPSVRHIAWGIIGVGLLVLMLVFWQNIQTLHRQNADLRQRLSQMDSQSSACTARDTWQAGTVKTFTTITSDGPRQYAVYLPKNFSSTAYYPLVINYPGKGASAQGGIAQSRLDTLPAISAYPYPTVGTDGHTAWEGAPYSSGADDVGFTIEMLDKIQSQLCINRHRVYATGMSNGGGMVSLLSCRLTNRFAAYGIVSGALYYPAGGCTPAHPTPLINVHGDSDPIVPYQGSSIRKLPNITSWSSARAHDNGCVGQPVVTNIDALTTVTTWNRCKNNATVENIKVHDGGHFWSPQTTELLWQFMSKHTL